MLLTLLISYNFSSNFTQPRTRLPFTLILIKVVVHLLSNIYKNHITDMLHLFTGTCSYTLHYVKLFFVTLIQNISEKQVQNN